MSFVQIARAAKWALDHPKFKQPSEPKPGDWVSWVERDESGKPVRICWTQIQEEE